MILNWNSLDADLTWSIPELEHDDVVIIPEYILYKANVLLFRIPIIGDIILFNEG